jgi:hypothetical protein
VVTDFAFLSSRAPDGTARWTFSPPTGAPIGIDVHVSAGGDVYWIGYVQGPVNFGDDTLSGSGSAMFLASFTAAGAPRFSTLYGTSGYMEPQHVKLGPSGEVFVSGYFNGTVDFGGGPLVSSSCMYIGCDAFIAKLQ